MTPTSTLQLACPTCPWEDTTGRSITCRIGRVLHSALRRARHGYCQIGGATESNLNVYQHALAAWARHTELATERARERD